jgi:hypothetical protein
VHDGVVEAWPLAPLAMARSGPLQPGARLSIDSCRISVELSDSDSEKSPSLRLPDPLSLEIFGVEKQWQANHRRAITIMGDDHPSLLRIGGAGLRPCHAAFISLSEGLWYIDLAASSSAAARLLEFDAPLLVGKLTIIPRRTTSVNELAKSNRLPTSDRPPSPAAASDLVVNGETSVAHADRFAEDITHRIVRIGRRKKLLPRVRKALFVCLVIALSAIVVMQIYQAVSDQLPEFIPKP